MPGIPYSRDLCDDVGQEAIEFRLARSNPKCAGSKNSLSLPAISAHRPSLVCEPSGPNKRADNCIDQIRARKRGHVTDSCNVHRHKDLYSKTRVENKLSVWWPRAELNHGHTDIQSFAQAAEALRPLAGRFAFLLFSMGIVGTGLLAVPVLAGSRKRSPRQPGPHGGAE